jgi:hypothetical protein
MNWTEIQTKWAAMARRVQSDSRTQDDTTLLPRILEPLLPSDDSADLRTPPPPERPVA